MDNTERFTGHAQSYALARPAYAEGVVDRLAEWAGLGTESVVADVGAGTGIFSAQLASTGAHIIAVEPNAEMRAKAEKRFAADANVEVIYGTAEQTGIANASVDLACAAQAFHWFDGEAFRTECLRILRGDARVALIWNRRVGAAPVNVACEQVFHSLCPRFKGFSGGVAESDRRIDDFFRESYETWRFSNDLSYDRERFVNRCLSGSYAPRPDDDSYQEFLAAVEDIFDRYQQDGTIVVPNETCAYVGSLRG